MESTVDLDAFGKLKITFSNEVFIPSYMLDSVAPNEDEPADGEQGELKKDDGRELQAIDIK